MRNQLSTFRKYSFLLSELVKKGIRLKYRKSYLGILWSLVEPILTTIVLVLVFGTLFGKDIDQQVFPLYVMAGRLTYGVFAEATKAACKSIRKNAAMIKKVYVPKYLYPLSDVLFRYIIFAISLLALVAVMIYCQKAPTFYIWQAIPALIIHLLTTMGISLILATANVFFRDIEYIWNVLCMLIMYCCAIFYDPSRLLKSGFGFVLRFNPIYCVIDIFRGAVMGYMSDMWNYAYGCGFSLVAMLVGVVVFKVNQDKFILHI